MPLWFADLLFLISLLVTGELMFRAGRATRRRRDENVRSQLATMQASSLGMLALFLAFTLSMAESRFNSRRVFLVQEAAAVGTTYLRADYLPEQFRAPSRELLRSYVDARRDYFLASPAEAPAATARAQAIQSELWSHAATLARAQSSEVYALYLASLNEMIDLEAARDIAIDARVPWVIRFLLVLVSIITVGITGYNTGIGGRRVAASLALLPVLIVIAYAAIADLDRSRTGYISTGDAPMERLRSQMQPRPASPATATDAGR